MNILSEQDIINTYNERQREQSKLYYKYKKIKEQNPSFGYKKIAKLLGHKSGKTRWWHAKKHTPVPIQTVNKLKEKELLPLKDSNPKLPLIAKILGTTFGDGGIFNNLNAIFLSSSELEAVKEFGNDLKLVFGNEIEDNSRIIEGGEYGHSWCYQNTNRNIIRLFQALGAPIGKKSEMNLKIPEWIFFKEEIADEFFSSFFGNELGTPSIHKNKKQLTSLDVGLVANINLINNRITFLNQIKKYLNNKGIKTGKISISKQEDNPLLRLSINKTLDNYLTFIKLIKLDYCHYKQEKLIKTANQFINNKNNKILDLRKKTNHLTNRPYSEDWIKHNLRLTEKSYKYVQNNINLEKWN